MPELIDTKVAAERLGVSASYLEKLRWKGGGPRFARLGTKCLYDPVDLADWVEASKVANTVQQPSA